MRKGIGLDIFVIALGVVGFIITLVVVWANLSSNQPDDPNDFSCVGDSNSNCIFHLVDSDFNNLYFEADPNIGIAPSVVMSYYDVVWLRDTNEVIFEWKDGKFNVIYDSNDCTESAITFFKCLLKAFPNIKEKICSEMTI